MSTAKPYISIDRIIERVYDDYGLPQVYRHSAIEWAVDTMLLISPTDLLIDKEAEVVVEEGRGPLPDDIDSINPGGVREKGSGKSLVYQSGAFQKSEDFIQGFSIYSIEGQAIIYDGENNLIDPSEVPTSVLSALHSRVPQQHYEYFVKNGYLYCGIREITLEVSYKGLVIDSGTGEPLIPDDTKIINAIVSLVAYRTAKKLIIKGELAQYAYQIIEQDYLFNIGSARSQQKILSPERMESLKNRYLSLIPRISEHNDGFGTSNFPEQLNF